MHPNPRSGNFSVQVNHTDVENCQINIYSTTGTFVYTKLEIDIDMKYNINMNLLHLQSMVLFIHIIKNAGTTIYNDILL